MEMVVTDDRGGGDRGLWRGLKVNLNVENRGHWAWVGDVVDRQLVRDCVLMVVKRGILWLSMVVGLQ